METHFRHQDISFVLENGFLFLFSGMIFANWYFRENASSEATLVKTRLASDRYGAISMLCTASTTVDLDAKLGKRHRLIYSIDW